MSTPWAEPPTLHRPGSREVGDEVGPRPGLREVALAAVGRAVDPDARDAPELAFLRGVDRAAAVVGSGLSDRAEGVLERPGPDDRPLVELREALDLTVLELLTVALACAVEVDPMAGRAVAWTQAPVGGSRPTVGLCGVAFRSVCEGSGGMELVTGGAAAVGLLELLETDAPLAERSVRVPLHLCLALDGREEAPPGASVGWDGCSRLRLPPSFRREAERRAAGLGSAENQALVLRTGSPAEGRAVAGALSGALGLRPAFLGASASPGLVPWLLVRRLLPVFVLETSPGERRAVPELRRYHGPVVVVCGPDGVVEHRGGSVPTWTLPVPERGERHRLWLAELDDEELAADLARHHRHGPGRIAQLARLMRRESAMRGRRRIARDDVVTVSRRPDGAGLEALAQPLPAAVPDEALVAPRSLRDDLAALLLRCRARDGLADRLGVTTRVRYDPGVRALFVGASGTGKTLAAGWLATRLGLPLFRVDLASVTSKYIGETEKNLAQLLARAEKSEVVLLFDEADSLFGKRTEVRNANDRFANAQTNYLLQRIETYDGIVVLTSNSRARFDKAFSRRLDLVVDFPMPGPRERRELWRAHLGDDHGLEPQDLNRLAATADLAGGHIRNAVLAAAVAAGDAGREIELSDVLHGLAAEYRKLGRQAPAGLRHDGAGQ